MSCSHLTFLMLLQAKLSVTYRNTRAGVNLAFPDAHSLASFQSFTALYPFHAKPPRPPPITADDLPFAIEEDITAAYQRSFGPIRPSQTCDYLYNDPGADLRELSAAIEWPEDSEDGSSWDGSDATSVESSEEFYDALESPVCVWFEIDDP